LRMFVRIRSSKFGSDDYFMAIAMVRSAD
jgi:hypothetical protein